MAGDLAQDGQQARGFDAPPNNLLLYHTFTCGRKFIHALIVASQSAESIGLKTRDC